MHHDPEAVEQYAPRSTGQQGREFRSPSSSAMGKKKRPEIIRVNPKEIEGKKQLPCFVEMLSFMTCLKQNNFDTAPCQQYVTAINACLDTQVRLAEALPPPTTSVQPFHDLSFFSFFRPRKERLGALSITICRE